MSLDGIRAKLAFPCRHGSRRNVSGSRHTCAQVRRASGIVARQPNALMRDTSRSLRGVPSGREVSNSIVPRYPTTSATSRANSAMVTSSPVPILRNSRSGIGFHDEDAGIGHVVDGEEFAPRRAGAPHGRAWRAVDLGLVEAPHQRRRHVAVQRVVIVARTVEIGRHHGNEVGAVLQAIGLAQFDAGDLGDRIPLIARLERARQQHLRAPSAAAPAADRCRTSRDRRAFARRIGARREWYSARSRDCRR